MIVRLTYITATTDIRNKGLMDRRSTLLLLFLIFTVSSLLLVDMWMLIKHHPSLVLTQKTVVNLLGSNDRTYSVVVTAFPTPATTTTTTTTTITSSSFQTIENSKRRRNLSILHSNVPKIIKSNSNSNSQKTDDPSASMTDLEKKYLSTNSIDHNTGAQALPLLGGGGYSRPVVQWYPGHIAKAERALGVTMKAVDVVVEVRDARIPSATSHPSVASQWCQNKPRIIVLTHMDAIPRLALQSWYRALLQSNDVHSSSTSSYSYNKTPSGNITKSSLGTSTADTALSPLSPNQLIQQQAAQVETVRVQYNPTSLIVTPTSEAKAVAKRRKMKRSAVVGGMKSTSVSHNIHTIPAKAVIFVNAKMGVGIHGLTRAILAAGQHIQDRRIKRGLLNRPLRVGVLGYPNVGKSALINKLIGRRRCATANLPGVTRSLQWIRVKHDTVNSSGNSKSKKTQEFELLDSPGIIPAILADQSDAMLLAACHCIGEASYDNQAVAAYLCEWLLSVHTLSYHKLVAPHWRNKVIERYKFDPITKSKPKQLYPHEEDIDSPTNNNRNSYDDRLTGEDMLYLVADYTCQGDPEDAARKILQDFRAGRMGPICLQVAPVLQGGGNGNEAHSMTNKNSNSNEIGVRNNEIALQSQSSPPLLPGSDEEKIHFMRDLINDPDDIVWQIQKQQRRLEQEQQEERTRDVLERIKSRGIALPQSVLSLSRTTDTTAANDMNDTTDSTTVSEDQNTTTTTGTTTTTTESPQPNAPLTPTSMIGKGLFEGW